MFIIKVTYLPFSLWSITVFIFECSLLKSLFDYVLQLQLFESYCYCFCSSFDTTDSETERTSCVRTQWFWLRMSRRKSFNFVSPWKWDLKLKLFLADVCVFVFCVYWGDWYDCTPTNCGNTVNCGYPQLTNTLNRGYPQLAIKMEKKSHSRYICILLPAVKILNSAYISVNISSQ